MKINDYSIAPQSMQATEKAACILVVDSDPGVRWSLERGLAHSGFRVLVADSSESAISLSKNNTITAIFFEIMPEAGLTVEILSKVISACNSAAIVCSSIDASPHNITDCIMRGCSRFLQRPFSLGEVRSELFHAISASTKTVEFKIHVPDAIDLGPSLIIGISEATRELRAMVQKVAQSNLNCLVRGSSGVGKDVVAREIHRLSSRKDNPFIKVNCTALPDQLLESELFGYEKGAFT
ncbi:MAG: sigma-54-dependent Fis family transcriptional regulator, partial [Flavobacteriales bacterium]|nr:sigma-54-dependent Fis family transcriptional regulator [Flavobacteriales bacterium]